MAKASSGSGPPVLLLHAWWGLNPMIKQLADRLAADGFTVLAPDLFEGKVLTTIADAQANSQVADGRSAEIKALAAAGLGELLVRPESRGESIAVVAVSFGAWYASLMAKERPEVKALVMVYGGAFVPGGTAAYLGHFAEDDPFDDSSEVPALQAALGERGEAHVYPGTKHWFFEPDRPEYQAEAAELAYRRTVEFLRRHIG